VTELGGLPVEARACTPEELDQALSRDPVNLVLGFWEQGFDQRMIAAFHQRRLRLKHLFIGDIVTRESEISWIQQTDISRLFGMLPELETLRIRGSNALVLGEPRHDRLKTLIIESGGLQASIARDLARSTLPALEHLELWIGRNEYGATTSASDLEPLFDPARLPHVRYLGLRNAEIADELAPAILQSPLAPNLETLDLSLGVINEQVAKALLGIPAARRIQTIDVGHHFLERSLVDRLRALGNVVGLEHRAEEEEERYTAIGE
jgi:hypothetical protein